MHGRLDRINSRNDGERRAESERSIIRYRPVRSVPPSERYSVLLERSNSAPTGEPFVVVCWLFCRVRAPRWSADGHRGAPRRTQRPGEAQSRRGSSRVARRWSARTSAGRSSAEATSVSTVHRRPGPAHILSVRPSFTLQLARICPSLVGTMRQRRRRGCSTHVPSASSRPDHAAGRRMCGVSGGGLPVAICISITTIIFFSVTRNSIDGISILRRNLDVNSVSSIGGAATHEARGQHARACHFSLCE